MFPISGRSASVSRALSSVTLRCPRRRRAGPSTDNPPDDVSAVVRDEQRAVRQHCEPDGSSIYLGLRFVGDETRQEVLRWAAGTTSLEGHEDHLVAREPRAVPGAVLADEGAAAVALRESAGTVER